MNDKNNANRKNAEEKAMQNRQRLTPIRTPNTTDDNCPYIAKAA